MAARRRAPDTSQPALQSALTHYFAGLSNAVAGPKSHFDAQRFAAHLRPSRPDTYAGTVDTYDPFTTGAPLTLLVDVRVLLCAGRRVVLVLASPRPRSDQIWERLRAGADSLGCR